MIGFTEIVLLSFSGLLIFLVKCVDKNPFPIFGIYERKNGRYWFKVAFMYILISLNKIKLFFKKEKSIKFYELEKPQKLPLGCEKASDIVTFRGANKNEDYFILNFAKRHENVDGFFFLKIKDSNFGVLTFPNFPNANLAKADENEYEYSTGDLKLIPLDPMKKWRLVYKGKMKQFDNTNIEHDVKIDGIWTSELPAYVSSNVDTLNIAKCMAYEKWSNTYFENFKKFEMNYYEQFGTLHLTIKVGIKTFDVHLDSIRGHTIGRNIDYTQYYKAAIHHFSTEKGDYFRIGLICAPLYGSRILEGFVYNSKENRFYPVKKCSLELYKYGGIDSSPDDYGFTMKAGKKMYKVHVKCVESSYIYSGEKQETKCYLKMCTFEVNGKLGWGTANWIYRNID